MSQSQGHDWLTRPKSEEDDEEDPIENMIKKTGCLELHYDVQICMADNRDWRKCQDKVAAFRKCIMEHNNRKSDSKEG